MTKRIDREEKENERLIQENRNLKSENRHLKKKLKQLNKGYYKFLYAENEEEEQELLQEVKEVAKKICWDCGIGEYQEKIVLNRRWRECSNCEKRGKTTIL